MSGWIAGATIAAGALGAGASLYGANKQAKSDAEAQRLNKAQFDAQQLQNWNQYLMQRGIDPAGNTTVGGYGSGRAINSRLPLWASVEQTTGASAPGELRVVRRGAAPAAGMVPMAQPPPRLVVTSPGGSGNGQAVSDNAQAAPSGAPSSEQKIKNLLDPLNVSGGKNKSFLDPLGIFG